MMSARDRGLVFRPSTGARIGNLLIRVEQRLDGFGRGFCRPLVEFFHLFSDPAHAGNFDFAVRRDPENGRDICESVGVGDGIGSCVVEQDRKS